MPPVSPPLAAHLVVMALEAEDHGADLGRREGVSVLYTGLGKVNAAIALTRQLAAYRHAGLSMPLVINFGSAGSRRFATGTLVACDRFAQRDMDVSALGFARGITPFETIPAELHFPPLFRALPHALCGSGDSFETGTGGFDCDVVDMEAYAYAKVCHLEQARFACVKYITDGADHSAADDWQASHGGAAAAFWHLYGSLLEVGAFGGS